MVNSSNKATDLGNKVIKARFAEIMRVSRPQVTKWDNQKRLVKEGRYVLVEESIALLRKTGSVSGFCNGVHAENKKSVNDAEDKTIEQLTKEVKATQLDLETKDAKTLFENARALREKEAALLAQIEREKAQASLVSIAVVEKIMFERARSCRDALITSARRMSPLITGKQDIGEVESLLTEEYRNLLEQFARLPLLNE